MSGYNQNCIISPMPQVSAATAAHSGPYTIKSSDSYQGALVVISGLAAETVAVQISPDGTRGRNPAFDVTPAALVTGLITERGVCSANADAMAQMFGDLKNAALERRRDG